MPLRESEEIRVLADSSAGPGPIGRERAAALTGTRCPVCGVTLGEPLWTCPRCLTLHHSDCAGYFGGCAVFGCRDNQTPERMETRHWPAAYGRLKRFLLFKFLQRSLLVPFVLGGFLFGCGLSKCPALLALGVGLVWLASMSYLALECPAQLWWFWLKWSLGKERVLEITVPRERLRAALGQGKAAWLSGRTAQKWVLWLWLFSLMLCPLVGAGPLVGALLGVALAAKCGEQYEFDRIKFGVLLARFEASYAPLPDKARQGRPS